VLFLSEQVEAKKQCKLHLVKLEKIQILQRQGNSLKQAESLRKREDKARNKWWQCEHTSTIKKKVKKVKKKKKQQNKPKANRVIPLPKTRAFITTKAVVIKSKYQGDKRLAWLEFYQQPKDCMQPKNIQKFASCSENKRDQRFNFEKQY